MLLERFSEIAGVGIAGLLRDFINTDVGIGQKAFGNLHPEFDQVAGEILSDFFFEQHTQVRRTDIYHFRNGIQVDIFSIMAVDIILDYGDFGAISGFMCLGNAGYKDSRKGAHDGDQGFQIGLLFYDICCRLLVIQDIAGGKLQVLGNAGEDAKELDAELTAFCPYVISFL